MHLQYTGIPENMINNSVFVFFVISFFRNYMRGPPCRSNERMEGKTVIVTGANVGCGLEAARELARRGMYIMS